MTAEQTKTFIENALFGITETSEEISKWETENIFGDTENGNCESVILKLS